MPILNVEIVTKENESLNSTLAQEIADIAGEVLNSSPQGTWVKVRSIEPYQYAENGGAAFGTSPVIVSVIKGGLQDRAELESEVQELTARIASICDRRAENVHIIYEPPGAGRVAFGGKLVG